MRAGGHYLEDLNAVALVQQEMHAVLLYVSMLHASPMEPGLRPRGEPATADQRADQRGAVRGMHRRTASRFSWDALNITKATACGWKKCYFPSNREGEGWLVARPQCLRIQCRDAAGYLPKIPVRNVPEMAPPSRWFPQYRRAWAFAEELRESFGVDHLLRGPPFLATLSREQATYLNAKLKALARRKRPRWRHWKTDMNVTGYYAAGPHAVQGVQSCSSPECIVLKCEPLTAKAEDFVANAPDKTKLSQGINQSFAVVAAMVKAHPCLKIDFQVYLRNDGAVLNIDLDRCDELLPRARGPLNDSQKLELAHIPGFCQKASGQSVLDEALKKLHGRLLGY